jgi:hypothetical protein
VNKCALTGSNECLGLKKIVVFPLTQPTLNFSPDPRNFIDPLKKKKKINSNLFQKYRTHICICNQCKDMGSSACVQTHCRGSMDTGYKAFIQFNKNFHNCL